MPRGITPIKPDTYEVDRFSAKTAKYVQESAYRYFSHLYFRFKDKKLEEKDFYEDFTKFSEDLKKKLQELKEIDHMVKLKEAVHFG